MDRCLGIREGECQCNHWSTQSVIITTMSTLLYSL